MDSEFGLRKGWDLGASQVHQLFSSSWTKTLRWWVAPSPEFYTILWKTIKAPGSSAGKLTDDHIVIPWCVITNDNKVEQDGEQQSVTTQHRCKWLIKQAGVEYKQQQDHKPRPSVELDHDFRQRRFAQWVTLLQCCCCKHKHGVSVDEPHEEVSMMSPKRSFYSRNNGSFVSVNQHWGRVRLHLLKTYHDVFRCFLFRTLQNKSFKITKIIIFWSSISMVTQPSCCHLNKSSVDYFRHKRSLTGIQITDVLSLGRKITHRFRKWLDSHHQRTRCGCDGEKGTDELGNRNEAPPCR